MAGKEKSHGGHFPKYIVLQAVSGIWGPDYLFEAKQKSPGGLCQFPNFLIFEMFLTEQFFCCSVTHNLWSRSENMVEIYFKNLTTKQQLRIWPYPWEGKMSSNLETIPFFL